MTPFFNVLFLLSLMFFSFFPCSDSPIPFMDSNFFLFWNPFSSLPIPIWSRRLCGLSEAIPPQAKYFFAPESGEFLQNFFFFIRFLYEKIVNLHFIVVIVLCSSKNNCKVVLVLWLEIKEAKYGQIT